MNFLPKIPAWLISGLLYGLAWPAFAFETGWLAWFALVPVLLRLRRVRSFAEHVRVSLPAMLVALPFVCWWLSYFSLWAMPVIWLTQGPLNWAPLGLLYPIQKRIGWQRAMLLLPLLWTVWAWASLYAFEVDLAVGGPVTTQCRLLFVNQFADLTGQWGLLCWTVGFNVLLALVIDSSAAWSVLKTIRKLALAAAGWVAGPVLYSAAVMGFSTLTLKSPLPPVQVGLVQTNEDSYAPITDTGRVQVLRRLVALGTKAAQNQPTNVPPDIIVAPEGAFPLPLLRDSALFAGMRRYVQYYDTPFATGLMIPAADTAHYYNEAFVFTPELSRIYEPMQVRPEDLQVYRKQQSLAFGEKSPWGLQWANRWLRPGKASVVLGNKPVAFSFTDRKQNSRSLAIAICWEQLYPATIAGLVRGSAEAGNPEFLAFIMNDGWFFDSPGPRILLALTQLRAIENRRSIARCSNQGYSGYVDPFGRVVSTLPRQQEATGQITVQANTKLTFFTRHPDWFPTVCGLVLVLSLVLSMRRVRKRQSGPPTDQTPERQTKTWKTSAS
jgi:apolipoprotein N-acyltransferase